MQLGDILVCTDPSPTGQERAKLACALAARSRARVIGYFLASRADSQATDAAAFEFQRQLETIGLEGEWVPSGDGDVVEDIANYARCADVVVVGLGSPSAGDDDLDVERLVIECGRPVLGVPIANVPAEIGRRIMVAWDGSREAARALHDSVPFLRGATSITIASIGDDPLTARSPTTLAAHLKRLGITAEVDTTLSLQLPIGEEILSRVDWEHIDLLVAGAFGHARIWEHLFGGPSMTLLHQMMVPVFVSH